VSIDVGTYAAEREEEVPCGNGLTSTDVGGDEGVEFGNGSVEELVVVGKRVEMKRRI
jgi:hypothetical protein